MTKKILITGGSGFLGVYLARKFLQKKYSVTLLDIAQLDAEDLIKKVTFIKGDICDKKIVYKALKGQDFLIHAAAALPIQYTKSAIFNTNIEGTHNVLDAAQKNKIKRVIYISSTAVYGVPKYLPETEDTPLDPIGYYGQSKVAAEKLCFDYMNKGLAINIVRPKTFLGPERLGVFQLWFEAIYLGKHVYILGNGKNKYQLLAVSDVVDLVSKMIDCKIFGEIFNAGAKEFSTWRNDLGAVIKHANSKTTIRSLPVLPSQIALMALEKMHLSPISAWHYKTIPVPSYVSIQKAEKLLKWYPQKSNKQLLIESYDWYKKHRNEIIAKKGTTHRVGWDFKLLNLLK